eukprot:GGOE01047049.1.p4 GENE.GGOE01047049.1~~GGOE01047049.1.p4  ORF type:complete len:101 (+),score=5.28 GGOE01047049.1:172-474(+)
MLTAACQVPCLWQGRSSDTDGFLMNKAGGAMEVRKVVGEGQGHQQRAGGTKRKGSEACGIDSEGVQANLPGLAWRGVGRDLPGYSMYQPQCPWQQPERGG